MAAVLGRLPETPVQAIGNNVSYTSAAADAEPLGALTACAKAAAIPDGFVERRRQFGVTLQKDGRDLLIQAAVSPELVELNGNVNVN